MLKKDILIILNWKTFSILEKPKQNSPTKSLAYLYWNQFHTSAENSLRQMNANWMSRSNEGAGNFGDLYLTFWSLNEL